jgi:hypothetical protein
MECPKCGKQMSWYVDGLIRPGFNSRYCIGCNSRLELVNSWLPYLATGLLFALGLLFVVMGEVSHLWAWLILLGVVCWLVNPIFVRLLGNWAVYDYTQAEISKANLLNAVNTISTLITAVLVGHLIMILLLPYWRILEQLSQMDNKAFGAMEEYVQILKPARIIGFVVGIISMGTSGTTSFMRHSLRRESLNRRLEQQQSNKPDEVI